MTDQRRRKYTVEFKREAVELVTKQGYSTAEAARTWVFAAICCTAGVSNCPRDNRMPSPVPAISPLRSRN